MEKIEPKLYLIASPIGNLQEISHRSLNILKNVDYIAAEDTRVSNKLLLVYKIKKKLISCHEHNEKTASDKIIKMIKNGKSIAYMCDAGTPGISDPGQILVQKCIQNNIDAIPISGPSAFLNAVIVSGFNINHFYFYGFLPKKESERKRELKKISSLNDIAIFYEAPHRLTKTLENMLEIFGDKKICLGKEITKMHEFFLRDTLKNVIEKIKKTTIKGEFVIIVDLTTNFLQKEKIKINQKLESEIYKKIIDLKKGDIKMKEIIKKIGDFYHIPKNKIYKIYRLKK